MVCWICGSSDLSLVRPGNLPEQIDASLFRITDSDYGRTADIFQCDRCGFRQCSNFTDVLQHYVEMDDTGYEETRVQRGLQARKLIGQVAGWRPSGRLLDVGAGSGILVEEALKQGYDAVGLEPSESLQRCAAEIGLPVVRGVLPQQSLEGPFDVVTLIDVIEHVDEPVKLLTQLRDVMARDGIGVVVTPDVGSVAARLLGRKWWHYRIAHIGYFDRGTLSAALEAAQLRPLAFGRPCWFFPANYLLTRLFGYLPRSLRPPTPEILGRITVPLNLFDSMMMVFTKH